MEKECQTKGDQKGTLREPKRSQNEGEDDTRKDLLEEALRTRNEKTVNCMDSWVAFEGLFGSKNHKISIEDTMEIS
jgi:hypothetical protein